MRLEAVGGHRLNPGPNDDLEALGDHAKRTAISRCEGWYRCRRPHVHMRGPQQGGRRGCRRRQLERRRAGKEGRHLLDDAGRRHLGGDARRR
jgi:hypothetical protein